MEEQEKKRAWDQNTKTEKNRIEAQFQKSLNDLHEEKEKEKKQVAKKLVRDHS